MRNVVLAALVGALALGHPAVSDAQLVLYDDFSSPLINPDKWYGTNQTGGAGNPTTEAEQILRSGQLEMTLSQYGLSNSDSGSTTGLVHLRVINPIPITTMQASVTVLSGEADACPTNASGAAFSARAEVMGNFFNDGSSTGANDLTGDVIARVGLAVDAAAGNVIQAAISRCSNSACSSSSSVGFQNFTGTWTVNRPQTLTLTWDHANHQFVFSAKPSGGSVETHSIPYTLSDSAPSGGPTKTLRIFNSAANCNGSQKHAFMDALFDTVMGNQ